MSSDIMSQAKPLHYNIYYINRLDEIPTSPCAVFVVPNPTNGIEIL